MPKTNNEFATYVVDMMQSFGPVRSKRMFGGYGIFLDGLMLAIVVDDTLYFKVDAQNEPRFSALGLERFTYLRQGKEVSLSFCRAPDETLEDEEAMNEWAADAYEAAARNVK